VDNQRNMILAVVLSALVLFGWSAVSERFFPTPKPAATTTASAPVGNAPAVGANAPAPTSAAKVQDRAKVIAATSRIAIRTPKLVGSINLTGARIDDLVLTAHRETVKKDSPPVRLLSPGGSADAYYAGFGWSGDGLAAPGPATIWQADGTALTPQTPVTLRWTNPTGQTFAIKLAVDANYMFTVEQSVSNAGTAPVTARTYAYVSRDGKSKDVDAWTNHVGPIGVFNGAANYSVNYEDLDTAGSGGTRFQSKGGWMGFGDHFWLAALVPPQDAGVDTGFRAGGNTYQADYALAPATIAPGTAKSVTSHLFAGAKETNILDAYEDNLGITYFGKAIDWGWFEVVEKPIFKYLDWLFRLTTNFGVAIILLTLTVRGLMYPIAQKQFASMAAMRVVQPKMKALQERYKDDKPRLQQETMALYKSEKINPLAGCAPILLQIPVFYALYKVLMLTIEMRHQPFVGWIKDLSAPDPFFFGLFPNLGLPAFLAIGVLPIIVGITQYIQFKLNPAPMDPAQEQVFKIMPFVLIFVMAPFAAGLQVYWMTTNILTILQQKLLYSRHPVLSQPVVK
jgi:YidC/Oxa1 family membrane protein insertase